MNTTENQNLEVMSNMCNWQDWCRLCAKEHVEGNVNVFLKIEQTSSINNDTCWNSTDSMSLATAIGRFFYVNISEEDDLPKTICSTCYSLLTTLMEVSERAVKVQTLFGMLQNAQVNEIESAKLQEYRDRCSLPITKLHQISTEFGYPGENRQLDEMEIDNPLAPQVICNELDHENENSLCEADGELSNDPIQTDDEIEVYEFKSKMQKEEMKDEPNNANEDKINLTMAKSKSVEPHRYECSICARKFKRSNHYKQHMSKEHQQEVKVPVEKKRVVPCEFCKKKFTTTWLMQVHIKNMHTRERPFICEKCGEAVRTIAALKSHMLVHTDNAPFECDVCKNCFKSELRLRKHKEIHDPNKHICTECGLQLNSRVTLNRHLLVHSDEMQHKCDYCGRRFKRAKTLKTHLIGHTGLKPYSCDFCERTFANGSNCRTHKKKAHPVELAAQEAAVGPKVYTRNIPKLDALKAITKNNINLQPVVSKQSGCFAISKKSRVTCKDIQLGTQRELSKKSTRTLLTAET